MGAVCQPPSPSSFRLFFDKNKSILPVFTNNTYALRSVNYGSSDVLVAFRVVRKDFDGSVVLLWKLLEEYPKPSLQRSVAAAGQ